MIELLQEPFTYDYMRKAIVACTMVGSIAAFLSVYLMIKGWSLMGDALSHSIVPGIAISSLLEGSIVVGSFFSAIFASLGMFVLRRKTKLKEDAIMGIVFTSFFALGLFIISLNPMQVSINSIVLGNVLTLSDYDLTQVAIITLICAVVFLVKWKDFALVFFDLIHAQTVGIKINLMRLIFFILLSLLTVAALQTVGAFLVIAMLITPGATAYLLSDRFNQVLIISTCLGLFTGFSGAYLSYFLDMHTGGLIVLLQTAVFITVLLISPKHGVFKSKVKNKRSDN